MTTKESYWTKGRVRSVSDLVPTQAYVLLNLNSIFVLLWRSHVWSRNKSLITSGYLLYDGICCFTHGENWSQIHCTIQMNVGSGCIDVLYLFRECVTVLELQWLSGEELLSVDTLSQLVPDLMSGLGVRLDWRQSPSVPGCSLIDERHL